MATRTALDGHPDRTTVHRPALACGGLLELKRVQFSDVFLSCFGGVMDADGQQHTSGADTPAGSALCVDAQPRGWKQLTSFADVRMKMNGVYASFAGS